jgi:hypothetical protein
MKILSKIKRRNNGDDIPKRGHYVEMELFDTDRNPLEFPDAAGAAPILSRFGGRGNGGAGASPPWNPFPWTYRLGVPIYDPSQDLVAPAVASSDASALKIVNSGAYIIQLKADLTLAWVGASSYTWTYPLRVGIHVFKYDSSGSSPVKTIAISEDNCLFDGNSNTAHFALNAIGSTELDANDEIGADLYLNAATGAPAGGDPWLMPDPGVMVPSTQPIQGTITRLGDHGAAVVIGV